MRCKNNHDNPDGAKFCCVCGDKLPEQKSCSNPECINYNKSNIPLDADFCPDCGSPLQPVEVFDPNAPFPQRHPEYNLIPLCEFTYEEKLTFFFSRKPHFIEDKGRSEGKNYYFIARDDKLGILCYEWHEHWYGDDHNNTNIIPMEFDKIEDDDPYFICYKDGIKHYYDRKGKKVK